MSHRPLSPRLVTVDDGADVSRRAYALLAESAEAFEQAGLPVDTAGGRVRDACPPGPAVAER
jgi:hypothetical protein